MAHILIADDEPGIRDSTRAVLERDGHIVSEEADGLRVIDVVVARRPDLVILDMGMPGRDGLDTLAALRQDHPAIKILAVSGGDALEEARLLGAHATLEKPYRRDELRAAIAALLKP